MSKLTKISDFFLFAIVALLPIYQKGVPLAIVLYIVTMLVSKRFSLTSLTKQSKWIVVGLASFYVAHLIGMFYTSNMAYGWFDLEIKLSFLFLPFFLLVDKELNKQKGLITMYVFIASLVLSSLLCLVNGLYNYVFVEQTYLQFFGSSFSKFLHIGYFQMYLNVAIAFIAVRLIEGYSRLTLKRRITKILVLLLFSIILILTTSKIGVVIFFAQILILGSAYTIQYKKVKGLAFMVIAGFVFYGMLSATKVTAHRFNAIAKVANTEEVDVTSVESSSVRILTWGTAFELIKENPVLGVGTGDIADERLEVYKRNGYTGAAEHNLNTHSQLLQTPATLGVFGAMSIILMFGLPFLAAIKTRNFVLGMAVIIVSLFAATESAFEVQAGTVFYAFIIPLLFVLNRKE